MLLEILLAERAQAAGFQPIFDAFSMECMLAKEISESVSLLSVFVKADRTFIKAAPRVVLKVVRVLEKPQSVSISD